MLITPAARSCYPPLAEVTKQLLRPDVAQV